MSDAKSRELFSRATQVLVGGVNSPVRAFSSVGGDPIFIERARGATLTGADGSDYVDYVGSWGPMIVGHAHPEVVDAIKESRRAGVAHSVRPPRARSTWRSICAKHIHTWR